MYHEGFRLERDFFYDPSFHGYDLASAEKKYEPYLEGLASRADLNYLFEESLGGLTVGHLRVGGGDFVEVKRVPVGLLGVSGREMTSPWLLLWSPGLGTTGFKKFGVMVQVKPWLSPAPAQPWRDRVDRWICTLPSSPDRATRALRPSAASSN